VKRDASGKTRSERLLDDAAKKRKVVHAEIAVVALVVGFFGGLLVGWLTAI
jgi:hypothetical protein